MILDDLYNPTHIVRWKKRGEEVTRDNDSKQADLRMRKSFTLVPSVPPAGES